MMMMDIGFQSDESEAPHHPPILGPDGQPAPNVPVLQASQAMCNLEAVVSAVAQDVQQLLMDEASEYDMALADELHALSAVWSHFPTRQMVDGLNTHLRNRQEFLGATGRHVHEPWAYGDPGIVLPRQLSMQQRYAGISQYVEDRYVYQLFSVLAKSEPLEVMIPRHLDGLSDPAARFVIRVCANRARAVLLTGLRQLLERLTLPATLVDAHCDTSPVEHHLLWLSGRPALSSLREIVARAVASLELPVTRDVLTMDAIAHVLSVPRCFRAYTWRGDVVDLQDDAAMLVKSKIRAPHLISDDPACLALVNDEYLVLVSRDADRTPNVLQVHQLDEDNAISRDQPIVRCTQHRQAIRKVVALDHQSILSFERHCNAVFRMDVSTGVTMSTFRTTGHVYDIVALNRARVDDMPRERSGRRSRRPRVQRQRVLIESARFAVLTQRGLYFFYADEPRSPPQFLKSATITNMLDAALSADVPEWVAKPMLAQAGGQRVMVGHRDTILMVDLEIGRVLRRFQTLGPHSNALMSIDSFVWSSLNRVIVFGQCGNALRMWVFDASSARRPADSTVVTWPLTQVRIPHNVPQSLFEMPGGLIGGVRANHLFVAIDPISGRLLHASSQTTAHIGAVVLPRWRYPDQ